MNTEPESPTSEIPIHPGDNTIEGTDQKPSSNVTRALLIGLAIGLVAVIVLQAFALISANQTDEDIAALNTEIVALNGQIDAVGSDVAGVQDSVAAVDRKVDELAASSLVAPAASGASAAGAPQAAPGWLPAFEQGQPDAALGVVLGEVAGVEYYTEADLTVDPADGTARAWLIWAHWCPHCQREMPQVSDWYEENADAYPNVELVSVTSSIDPSRGNPLEPYLEELQLSFPTLVDPDLMLAEQFGLNAFPFWVFTAGDGTTLLRVAGFLEIQQVSEIFDQLNALSA